MGQPLRERIRQIGRALGFARVGFASLAEELPHQDFLLDWVKASLCGELRYLRQEPERRCRPTALLPSARTAIVALAHHGDARQERPETRPSTGRTGGPLRARSRLSRGAAAEAATPCRGGRAHKGAVSNRS